MSDLLAIAGIVGSVFAFFVVTNWLADRSRRAERIEAAWIAKVDAAIDAQPCGCMVCTGQLVWLRNETLDRAAQINVGWAARTNRGANA